MKLKHTKVATLAATLITLVSLAGGATTATIVTPSGITSSGAPTSGRNVEFTIDQSGLSSGYTSGVTDFDTYISSNPTHDTGANAFYLSDIEGATINISFLQPTPIDRLAFWNYPFENSAGISRMEVFSSPDASFSSLTSLGAFNPVDGSPNVQVFDILDTTTQFVRLQTETLFNFRNSTGFSEIAFSSPIPEPSSGILLGLGALGLVARRNRTA